MGVDIEANVVDQITGRRNSGSIAQYMEWCASYTSTCIPGIDFKFNMYVQSKEGVVENGLKATPSYMLFLSMLAVTRVSFHFGSHPTFGSSADHKRLCSLRFTG